MVAPSPTCRASIAWPACAYTRQKSIDEDPDVTADPLPVIIHSPTVLPRIVRMPASIATKCCTWAILYTSAVDASVSQTSTKKTAYSS